jgi:hypothetical protein
VPGECKTAAQEEGEDVKGPYIVRVWAVCGGTYDDAFENMDDALRESDRLNYSNDWVAVVYDADGVEVF